MTIKNNLPPGVLIKKENIRERCGNCKEKFILETYLDPLTEKRSYRVLCMQCNVVVPTGDDY
jgi:hypothetical protein